jgi:N-acetyl-anhydromuramyl-L-alanine amidase AmpD
MLNIEKYGNFKSVGKQKKKKQIILCHTSREVEEYLTSLEFRCNSNYDKIPNYVITNNGTILQLLSNDGHTNFFTEDNINRNSIVVCLENLGWLKKTPLGISYSNWIGDIYSKDIFEKKWRDKIWWEPYPIEQIDSLVGLSKKLLSKFSIDNKFIGHNTKVEGVKLFNGIVCRSNFNNRFTDLSPSFNYEYFKNNIENEG